MNLIYFYLKSLFYIFKKEISNYNKDVIVRGACLTNDSLKILNNKFKFRNFQKSRIDLLNNLLLKKIYGPNFLKVHYVNNLLYNLYIDQMYNFWDCIKTKKFLIIDSYSELTDQLFVIKNSKNYFCANYSDINKKYLEDCFCEGLLKSNLLFEEYNAFFNNIISFNEAINIIYIFFPIHFEKRNKFINQHVEIQNVIFSLKDKFNLKIIQVPDELLKLPRTDNFPYHYNEKVYEYVSQQLNNYLCIK